MVLISCVFSKKEATTYDSDMLRGFLRTKQQHNMILIRCVFFKEARTYDSDMLRGFLRTKQ